MSGLTPFPVLVLQVINDDRLPFPSDKVHGHTDRARVCLVFEVDELADAFGLHMFRPLFCGDYLKR